MLQVPFEVSTDKMPDSKKTELSGKRVFLSAERRKQMNEGRNATKVREHPPKLQQRRPVTVTDTTESGKSLYLNSRWQG